MNTESAVPAHLRRFVVRQDYDQYTEEDQAVWRFVVLQTHARLLRTAHPAYRAGFDAAGISVDRIPRIDEMSARLSRSGWTAVPVDGFIPPRAFQAFQARGVLPVATDIRTSRHLTYTPAPDIIHEAAGHAPFLTEPHYGNYVRRFGEVAENAFTVPADTKLYDAIYTLSEVKEDPASGPDQVARAEHAVAGAALTMQEPSESAKLARLYWWTAEYGLVGTPTDFRLYGAGLLSSIGEGYSCFAPNVQKLPLSEACIAVNYDITRTQPQLFVARELAELDEVLDRVSAGLAYRVGGDVALDAALASEEAATVELDSGACVAGVVTNVRRFRGEPALIEFTGSCAVASAGAVLDEWPRTDGYALPLGPLEDGTSFARRVEALGNDERIELRFASGILLRGRTYSLRRIQGRAAFLLIAELDLSWGSEQLFHGEGSYPLAVGDSVVTARASVPNGFFPATPTSKRSVPPPRTFDAAQRELIGLYERGAEAWRRHSGPLHTEFETIADRLDAAFPEEWLLRWNLLESLSKAGEHAELGQRLESDLERLELRFDHLEPIATGLSHIRTLLGRTTQPEPTTQRRPP